MQVQNQLEIKPDVAIAPSTCYEHTIAKSSLLRYPGGKTRAVKNFTMDTEMNMKLWEIAEEYLVN